MDTTSTSVDTILVVIVLYKTKLHESKSYQSIRTGFTSHISNDQQVDLIVLNNGPVSVPGTVDDKMFRLRFVEQLDNPGVSKAYNVAGRWAQKLGKQWMLLLDQDTELPINFWAQYRLSIGKYPDLPVHAPKLYDGIVLASPCGYQFYRGYVLPKICAGSTSMKGKNVLNSGLLVSVEAFWEVGGYDESVDLYFSDFVFFDRLKKLGKDFAVIDVDLAHNLSSSDYSDKERALYRFHLYCKGAYAASKGRFTKKAIYLLTVGGRSLLMNKRFNTFRFSRILFVTWLQNDKAIR